MGGVVFFDGGLFIIEGSRYIGLVLFDEGLDLFSPSVASSFWLLAVADLSFRPPLVMANSGGGSYGRFNLQKIWRCVFDVLYYIQRLSILRLFCGLHDRGVLCWWKLRFLWPDLVKFHGDGVF